MIFVDFILNIFDLVWFTKGFYMTKTNFIYVNKEKNRTEIKQNILLKH